MVHNQPINEISALLGQRRRCRLRNSPVTGRGRCRTRRSALRLQIGRHRSAELPGAAGHRLPPMAACSDWSSLLGGLFKAFPSDRRVKTDIPPRRHAG